jgi:predicted O-methyltransferase YrrM
MLDDTHPTLPPALGPIQQTTEANGFTMASDVRTGALLRTLAASKLRGSFLELGTGTGVATAWLLDGMDPESTLLTVDNDDAVVSVARRHLGEDPRVTFVVSDGADYLRNLVADPKRFDLVFADAWPGKYTHLEQGLQLVKVGGIYVVDDMLPQPNWPDDHPPRVTALTRTLLSHPDLLASALDWSTGIIIATKVR